MTDALHIAFVEPFMEGSHAAFYEGWAARSRHRFSLCSLPGERWKWRMRTGALALAEQVRALEPAPDVVVVTSLCDLAHLRHFSGSIDAPFLLYFHENQLSYPRPAGETLDRGFAVAHLASVLAADDLAFNSAFHRGAMSVDLERFLAEVPEPRPEEATRRVRRARVLPPGVDFEGFPEPGARPPGKPPLIVWNHRWEEDKRPSAFARVVMHCAAEGLDFRLALLGTTSQVHPQPLIRLRELLAKRIEIAEPAKTREEYVAWLARADIAVSTAAQENFGYAAVEAMAAGAVPLLPERLSYPEILGRELARELLYRGDGGLEQRLEEWLRDPQRFAALREPVMRHARSHAWALRVEALDGWVEEAEAGSRARDAP